jgi:hypothetical protein
MDGGGHGGLESYFPARKHRSYVWLVNINEPLTTDIPVTHTSDQILLHSKLDEYKMLLITLSNMEPSIQSFFKPTIKTSACKRIKVDHGSSPGDGFTQEERGSSPSRTWKAKTEYPLTDISDLVAGPGAVSFMGTVVNIYQSHSRSKKERSAKGHFQLALKDDTGVIVVSSLSYVSPT